jgi:hypothetical protein
MVAPPDHDRALLMEALWRATDALATSSPTLGEAAVLRAQIHDLMGKLAADAPLAHFGAGDGSSSPLRSAI